MAKNESKCSRSYVISLILISIAIVAFAVLSYSSYMKYESLKQEKKEADANYTKIF